MDKAEFRRRAEAKAKATLAQRKRQRESGMAVGVDPADETAYIKSHKNPDVTLEEKKVLEAYRKWKLAGKLKEEDDGATAPATNEAGGEEMSETKHQRIERLKRKIERRRRVEGLKAKLAEKRNADKPDAIREQAMALKERIQTVRKQLRSMKEDAMPAPMAPPAGAATDPNAMMGGDPNAMGGAAIPNLPPEITAEIQNIATAAQALAQMAGVAPAAPQPGADLDAGIPAEAPGSAGSGMLPENAKRIARIKVLLEKKKAEKKKAEKDEDDDKKDGKKKFPFGKKKEEVEGDEANEDEKMIEATRARSAARREALAKIRAKAMSEKSYEAEEKSVGDVQGFVKSALDTGGAVGGNGYNHLTTNAIQQAGVKHDGASPSMPGKSESSAGISPARVWPAKNLNYGGKVPDKMPKTPDYNPARKGSGQPRMPGSGDKGAVKESAGDDWAEKNVDHFIERKELNFRQLLSEGRLG